MDYEKKYKEALEDMRMIYPNLKGDAKLAVEHAFPELRESEDERIRKVLLNLVSNDKVAGYTKFYEEKGITCDDAIAYLEKQKEQKPVEIKIDNPNIQKIDPDVMISTSDSSAGRDGLLYASWRDEKAEQKPNIELIQKSWYMEGYHDCEFGYEPRWVIKTGEGGPRYEENPKYGQPLEEEQKPAEKQDYSGLNDFERAIHRGFLCAGVENVPVNIIKETAQDCLAHLSAEWSEADEEYLADCIDVIDNFYAPSGELKTLPKLDVFRKEYAEKLKSWLKSLRNRVGKESLQPHWKPSEEQMRALWDAYKGGKEQESLRELIEQLKKL